jgi:hypothetical protein
MKRRLHILVLTFPFFLFSILSAPANCLASTTTIEISAFIDGRDLLVIQGNTLQWNHLDFDLPGKWGGTNYPTIIDTKLNGSTVLEAAEWYPTWYGNNSDVFTGLVPTVPSTVALILTPILFRDSITIFQSPTLENGYTTIVDFNDNLIGGAGWYEARLEYIFSEVPLPASVFLFASGLAGLAGISKSFRKKNKNQIRPDYAIESRK